MNTIKSTLAALGNFLRSEPVDSERQKLEKYLSSAQSLSQLEDMQRRWDKERCSRFIGSGI